MTQTPHKTPGKQLGKSSSKTPSKTPGKSQPTQNQSDRFVLLMFWEILRHPPVFDFSSFSFFQSNVDMLADVQYFLLFWHSLQVNFPSWKLFLCPHQLLSVQLSVFSLRFDRIDGNWSEGQPSVVLHESHQLRISSQSESPGGGGSGQGSECNWKWQYLNWKMTFSSDPIRRFFTGLPATHLC